MKLWRLSLERYAAEAFSGQGAQLYGGRWSPIGQPVVYLSGSVALAVLETLVHADTSVWAHEEAPKHVVFALDVPHEVDVSVLDTAVLPENWAVSPARASLQDFGDAWFREKHTAILQVPSVIVPVEHNYLFNPLHRDAGKIGISAARRTGIDGRLWE